MLRLLIVDQSEHDCQAADGLFAELGFSSETTRSALDALARCNLSLPDVLIVDSALQGALDLISAVRLMGGGSCCRILYGVANADLRALMAGKRAGADDFLLKPYDMKVLASLFQEVLAKVAAA